VTDQVYFAGSEGLEGTTSVVRSLESVYNISTRSDVSQSCVALNEECEGPAPPVKPTKEAE